MTTGKARETDHGRTRSLWQAAFSPPQFAPLAQDLEVGVCVVGAGIAGLSAAYQLALRKHRVVVLDKTGIGGGETGFTTAHLTHALDDRYVHVRALHGAEGARLAAESHTAAIDSIERVIDSEGIQCEFARVDGYLFLRSEDSRDLLDRELEAAREAGLRKVERVDRAPITSFDTGPCLRFPEQAQFHPLKYVAGLAGAIQARSGQVFTHTRVTKIEPDGDTVVVTTEGGPSIRARSVVVATGAPIHGPKEIAAKQAAYQTYVVAAVVPEDAIHTGLYWDTGFPYHYVRVAPHSEPGKAYLIVGGEDHKTGQVRDASDRFTELEEWTRKRFPMAKSFEHRWSGEVMETMDGVAMIGRVPGEKNVYVATGDSGQGMTHGTIAGLLIADLIGGTPNAWAKLYEPGRKRPMLTKEFFKETFDMAKQYAKNVQKPEIEDVAEIQPDSGAVIQEGKEKIAVYRDGQGHLHRTSAVCTHLGCTVDWNAVEKTWDCPCHGSRFDRHGEVIHGPAVERLESREGVAAPGDPKRGG